MWSPAVPHRSASRDRRYRLDADQTRAFLSMVSHRPVVILHQMPAACSLFDFLLIDGDLEIEAGKILCCLLEVVQTGKSGHFTVQSFVEFDSPLVCSEIPFGAVRRRPSKTWRTIRVPNKNPLFSFFEQNYWCFSEEFSLLHFFNWPAMRPYQYGQP